MSEGEFLFSSFPFAFWLEVPFVYSLCTLGCPCPLFVYNIYFVFYPLKRRTPSIYSLLNMGSDITIHNV